MSLLGKLRPGNDRAAPQTVGIRRPAQSGLPGAQRVSNGLKDFLWLLGEVQRGRVLDLGPVWQSTVSFFTERGFRVSTEDLLWSWKDFLREEEQRLRLTPVGAAAEQTNRATLAERFLSQSLRYPEETFHAILAWDVCDYLDGELLPRVGQRLYELLRPGGVLLAAFHAGRPDGFHRYRVVDTRTIEVVAARPLIPLQRVFQNREILNLFSRFRSSKTFVGRDQLREALFLK